MKHSEIMKLLEESEHPFYEALALLDGLLSSDIDETVRHKLLALKEALGRSEGPWDAAMAALSAHTGRARQ